MTKLVDEFAALPRAAIAVLFALAVLDNAYGWRGATYRGLAAMLGLRSKSAVRSAVRKAIQAELVTVIAAGGVRGTAIIRMTPRALKLLARLEKSRNARY